MTTCTLCGGPPAKVLLRSTDRVSGQRFEVCACKDCGTAFTAPRPEDFTAYYGPNYYAFRGVELTPLERARLGLIARGPYRPIARRPPGRMLDVGCGAGRLAGAFRRLGWEVAGIEPSASGAEAARAGHMQVHLGTLDDALPWTRATFDAIIFNHSLEHIADPVAALRRAATLCRPGGLIGVTVPNFDSWQRRLFGEHWLQLEVPRHLTHFTRTSLAEAAQQAALRVVKLSSTSMLAGFAGSAARATQLPVGARGLRLAGLAAHPLFVATDPLVGGDCLNLVARVQPVAPVNG